MIRAPTPDDIPDLARIHVQAWAETYAGIVPDAVIARFDIAFRTRQWQGALAREDLRTAYAPGQGFAQVGPQRDPRDRADWPEELYAIYLRDAAKGRGLGRALLRAVLGDRPVTALVLEGNDAALGFYQATGARRLDTRRFDEDGFAGIEHLVGWTPPFTV
ncbi:MAG: acetyltransferase family protein [Rhodobacteraceae bacterium HLUCCA08]|nr:MAG: acetyltransferase family protein [Rhodobacteraceae bacterium HLUCCA08]